MIRNTPLASPALIPVFRVGTVDAVEIPGRGRFHVMPDGRRLAFYYVRGQDAAGKAVSENRLVELRPDGTSGP
jgi:hypothetical protein